MDIKINKSYKILGFSNDCPHHYMKKLLSFGFVPGEKFYIANKANFGNPYHILIRNLSMSLRKSEILYMRIEAQ